MGVEKFQSPSNFVGFNGSLDPIKASLVVVVLNVGSGVISETGMADMSDSFDLFKCVS